MYGWGYNNIGAGMGIAMVFFMLLFWAVVAVGIVALVRRSGPLSSRFGASPETPETPEGVLRGRFARGEIDEAEFRARLTALREYS